MIREKRSKEKLQSYYTKFITARSMDPNVHPWVAESWQLSSQAGIQHERMPQLSRLRKDELKERQSRHKAAISYLDGMYRAMDEHFNLYQLSLLLLDSECVVLKNYALPFYQRTPGELEGARLTENDIGTSSIAIAARHKAPFLLFGPEMWIKECQSGDACSAPVFIGDELQYIITLVAVGQDELPYSSIAALLLGMKYALELHLVQQFRLEAREAILDAVPHAVYHILPGGEVAYTNKLGQSRLAGIDTENSGNKYPDLSNLVINYRHTPLYKGFQGIPSYNKEVTWITPNKTYEDITTVAPLYQSGEVSGIVAVSQPIEDLRILVAHAVGYTARYSMGSMVGMDSGFITMKDKAARAAKSGSHVLLQGEPGTGKQRLAHGIHQASQRAAGPLIAVRCGDMMTEMLEVELFGGLIQGESQPGKLELANGGTLFLDEIEKIPYYIQNRLADALATGQMNRTGESVRRPVDVRIIAACDGDVKRLAEKGGFCSRLYEIVSKAVIKMPSLRCRKDDIPLLAAHIADELAEQHNLAHKELSAEAAELLTAFDWPGNIKQLQGVVEHAFFHTVGETIKGSDISLPGDSMPGRAWKEDRAVFVDAWKAAGGNISRLANMLDVSRVTLYRYLKKYGLDRT